MYDRWLKNTLGKVNLSCFPLGKPCASCQIMCLTLLSAWLRAALPAAQRVYGWLGHIEGKWRSMTPPCPTPSCTGGKAKWKRCSSLGHNFSNSLRSLLSSKLTVEISLLVPFQHFSSILRMVVLAGTTAGMFPPHLLACDLRERMVAKRVMPVLCYHSKVILSFQACSPFSSLPFSSH